MVETAGPAVPKPTVEELELQWLSARWVGGGVAAGQFLDVMDLAKLALLRDGF